MKTIKDKNKLLDNFERAVNITAKDLSNKKDPLVVASKMVYIDNYIIYKVADGSYSIKLIGSDSDLVKEIPFFEAARILVNLHMKKRHRSISEIVELFKEYEKYKNDMANYLRCFKHAKDTNMLSKLFVLEDKFQIAEQKSRQIKNHILGFKIYSPILKR